jgi:hypothetical protein
MSFHGWQVLRAIEEGEEQLAYLTRYSDRLTPKERDRIKAGNFGEIFRPIRPTWTPGQWLTATPKLTLQVGSVKPWKGVYRTTFSEIRDFRSGGLAVNRRLHEDMSHVSTIVPVNDWPADPPEPERVPDHEIGTYRHDMVAQQRHQFDLAQRRKAYESQPLELRLARLRRMADESHVDISAEERVIERRIAALERKLLERAA